MRAQASMTKLPAVSLMWHRDEREYLRRALSVESLTSSLTPVQSEAGRGRPVAGVPAWGADNDSDQGTP